VTTEWPARLARDGVGVLCGRRGPDGRAVCQGLVGMVIDHHNVLGRQVHLPNGYRESSPGWWEPVTFARERIAAGQRPRTKRPATTATGDKVRILPAASLPYRVPCPHCPCMALVTSAILLPEKPAESMSR
jgi:hypothetical protein